SSRRGHGSGCGRAEPAPWQHRQPAHRFQIRRHQWPFRGIAAVHASYRAIAIDLQPGRSVRAAGQFHWIKAVPLAQKILKHHAREVSNLPTWPETERTAPVFDTDRKSDPEWLRSLRMAHEAPPSLPEAPRAGSLAGVCDEKFLAVTLRSH